MTLKVYDHPPSKSNPLLSQSPLILLNSNFSTSTPITTTNQPIHNSSHCILNQKRVNHLPSTTTKNHQLYTTLSTSNPFFIKPTNANTFTQQLSYYYPIIGLPNWNQSYTNSIPNGVKKRFIPHFFPTISMNSLNMFPTSSNQSIHNYLDLNSIPSYPNPSSFLTSQEDYELTQFNQSYQSSPINHPNQFTTPEKHQIELNEEFLSNLNQFLFENLINNSSYLRSLNEDQFLQEEERDSKKRSFEEIEEQVNQSPTLKIKKIKFNNYKNENEIQSNENENLALSFNSNFNEFDYLTQDTLNPRFPNYLTNQRPTSSSSIQSNSSTTSSFQFNQPLIPSFEDFDSQFGFICPKCNKSHSRQSNLLAHLRDTHSTEKKIQCDILGCQKAYKRVSECRRHKKDIHGIPLPSEVLGKVKRVRRNFTN
ncbi:hypothetical protein DFH28DRAFT_963593 [Melampsora americana]|nr:hypothetical protein DFH28DRAFT_963593 [Melampsora americana]